MSAPPQRRMLSASEDAQIALEKRLQERAQYLDRMQEIEARREEGRRKSEVRRIVDEKVIEELDYNDAGELVRTKRTVKKFITTLDLLEKRGQLEKNLRQAFDILANAVSLSSGACISDRDLRGGTNRGIASWESQAQSDFGPRDVSAQILAAEEARKQLMRHIPSDMMKLASLLMFEETGQVLDQPIRLEEFGSMNGFGDAAQARASGATMAIDLCRIMHHAVKQDSSAQNFLKKYR